MKISIDDNKYIIIECTNEEYVKYGKPPLSVIINKNSKNVYSIDIKNIDTTICMEYQSIVSSVKYSKWFSMFASENKYIDEIYKKILYIEKNGIFIFYNKNRIYVKSPFEFKDKLKNIYGRKWDNSLKAWTFNDSDESISELSNIFNLDISSFLGKTETAKIIGDDIQDKFPVLLPHQVHTVLKALPMIMKYKGFLISLDTGLGKTFTSYVIAYYLLKYDVIDKIAVLTTSGAMNGIEREYTDRNIIDNFTIFSDNGKSAKTEDINSYDCIITTHQTFSDKTLYEKFKSERVLIIVDEASVLKNGKTTKLYKSLIDIRKNNPNVYIVSLTATPLENNLSDVYNILHITAPNFLTSGEFYSRFVIFKKQVIRGGREIRIIDKYKDLDGFKSRISQIYVRILKTEVGELKDAIVNTYILNGMEEQIELNEILRRVYKLVCVSNPESAGALKLTYLMYSIMIANSPRTFIDNIMKVQEEDFDGSKCAKSTLDFKKRISESIPQILIDKFSDRDFTAKLDKLLEIIKSIGNEKCIVFTQFVKIQNNIMDVLVKNGYKVLVVNGSMSPSKKQEQVDLFKNSDYDVLIGTDSLARGVNLQFCHHLVNYDMNWNPAIIQQKIGRINRLSSDVKDKYIYNLLTNPIEERLYNKLVAKENLAIKSIELKEDVANKYKVIQKEKTFVESNDSSFGL